MMYFSTTYLFQLILTFQIQITKIYDKSVIIKCSGTVNLLLLLNEFVGQPGLKHSFK